MIGSQLVHFAPVTNPVNDDKILIFSGLVDYALVSRTQFEESR